MTLFPRMTISPIVSPSAGTSRMSSSTTRIRSASIIPTPWRESSLARAGTSSSGQPGCHSHTE